MAFGGFACFSRRVSRLHIASTRLAPPQQRVGESKRFVVGNANLQPLTGREIKGYPQCLNFSKRFGSCNRYYTSSRSKSSHKSRYPWKSFLFLGFATLGVGGWAVLSRSHDKMNKGTGEKLETEKNRWVLYYFDYYSSSPEVGELEIQKVAEAIKILKSKQIKIRPVFYTMHPRPAYLRAYIKGLGASFVVLKEPTTRTAAKQIRNFFHIVKEEASRELAEVLPSMYLVSPHSVLRLSFGDDYGAHELAEAITKEVMKRTSVNNPV